MTKSDEIEDAEAAVEEATKFVSELEVKLLAGDADASAADLIAAEHVVEERRSIVERVREFVRRRADIAAEESRVARAGELVETVHTMFGRHEGDIVDDFGVGVDALTVFVHAVDERNAQFREMRDALRAVAPLPTGSGVDVRDDELYLRNLDVRIKPIDPVELLAEAAWRALDDVGLPSAMFEDLAHISADHSTNRYLGVEARPDGPAGKAGPSDWLRRIALIGAARVGDGRSGAAEATTTARRATRGYVLADEPVE